MGTLPNMDARDHARTRHRCRPCAPHADVLTTWIVGANSDSHTVNHTGAPALHGGWCHRDGSRSADAPTNSLPTLRREPSRSAISFRNPLPYFVVRHPSYLDRGPKRHTTFYEFGCGTPVGSQECCPLCLATPPPTSRASSAHRMGGVGIREPCAFGGQLIGQIQRSNDRTLVGVAFPRIGTVAARTTAGGFLRLLSAWTAGRIRLRPP